MENKINIAELLKDCPKGMELDYALFEDTTFISVEEDKNYPILIKLKDGSQKRLTKYGCHSNTDYAKCVIFPKGKTTWEGFHKPFNNGDIVYFVTENDNKYITIFKNDGDIYLETYIDFAIITSRCSLDSSFYIDNIKEQRLATEQEKIKFFQAIENNNYVWNAETKILTKRKKFKDGDILTSELGSIFILKEPDINKVYYSCYIALDFASAIIKNCKQFCSRINCRFATEEEKQKLFDTIKANGYKWNPETKTLEKLQKFKVGDRIRLKNGGSVIEVTSINNDGSICVNGMSWTIKIKQQENYELVPNKFDITTLKPFESRVLVRNTNDEEWLPTFWGYYREHATYRYATTAGIYYYCIPYRGNEYLRGTSEDCADFYKTWEE